MKSRHECERQWKENFAQRLQALFIQRGISIEMAAEVAECKPDRIRTLLKAEDYPTVVEILRFDLLCYDADEFLMGARTAGFRHLFHGY